jgi:tRNA A-37 threonylcarbamoyl transferase component Bud32
LVFHSPVRVTLHLAARAADVDRWARGEAKADLLKSNGGRKLWRVAQGEPALYVKWFPREVLRDRARKEARLLETLAESSIPCPRLVAHATDDSGSYLLTEEVPDARPLSELLRKDLGRARSLLEDLGRLSRRLHDAGFDHQDFHAGNVLVAGDRLTVIDVHRAEKKRSLSRARRFESLAFMALSFVEFLPVTDLLRYLRAYGLKERAEWVEVWDLLRERRHDYFLGRQKRAFKEGTSFGLRGSLHFRKGTDVDALLKELDKAPREKIRATEEESLERVGRSLFVKTTTTLRARKIWVNAHGLTLRGIDTPKLHVWKGRWVAGEWIESVDLHDYIQTRYGALSRRERSDFLFRLARIVRRMHDYGAYHGDLKAGNVLVGQGRIALVDLDRVRFLSEVPERKRLFNLAQLNAAVLPPLSKSDRLRFLDCYIGRCAGLRERRRDWVRDVMAASRERKHRWPPR